MKKIDILSIGNITQDIIKVDKKKYYSLGGTSFYAYKVSEKLGFDLEIISEISNKIDYGKYIDIKKLISQKTVNHTIFENNYIGGIRTQNVINKPGKILNQVLLPAEGGKDQALPATLRDAPGIQPSKISKRILSLAP